MRAAAAALLLLGCSNGPALPLLALKDAGSVVNYPAASELSVGLDQACLRDAAGDVYCWGGNLMGEVGNGMRSGTRGGTPVTRVAGLPAPAVQISAGLDTCARLSDGTAWCWGASSFGSLGDGSASAFSLVPVPLTALGNDVIDVAAARGTGCALKGDHSVWCWGYNTGGALGFGPDNQAHPTPTKVATATSDWAHVTAGNGWACGLKLDGSLFCWGLNDVGDVGAGFVTAPPAGVTTPTAVATGGSWLQVVAGNSSSSCAVRDDHSVWCWGENQYGQLGQGTTDHDPHPTPVQVTDLGTTVQQLAVSGYAVCATKLDGTVWCWGLNLGGSLCVNAMSGDSVVRPAQLQGLSGAAASVAIGESIACVRDTLGAVFCCENSQLVRPR